MADDKTREEVVTENIAATELKYGPENWHRVIVQLLKDINVSLAKLVDGGGES